MVTQMGYNKRIPTNDAVTTPTIFRLRAFQEIGKGVVLDIFITGDGRLTLDRVFLIDGYEVSLLGCDQRKVIARKELAAYAKLIDAPISFNLGFDFRKMVIRL